MKYRTAAVLIAALMAGCTGPPSQILGSDSTAKSGGAGISVTFKQLGSYALENEQVTMQLTAENQGQSEATSISADVFGASWISASVSLGSLEGVDRAAGQSGGDVVKQFTLSPPDVDPGTTKTFDATAQVSYGYETRGILPLTLDPRPYVPSQEDATVQTGIAPVQLSTSLQEPVATGAGSSHPVQITIENSADGTITSDVRLKGSLQSPPSGVSLSGCDTTVSVSDTATVTCTVETPSDGVSFETTVPLRLTATYNYQQEADTTITVRGIN